MALKKDDDKALARSEQTVTDEKKSFTRRFALRNRFRERTRRFCITI